MTNAARKHGAIFPIYQYFATENWCPGNFVFRVNTCYIKFGLICALLLISSMWKLTRDARTNSICCVNVYIHYIKSTDARTHINSLRPSDAYMHQETKSSLVQIMAFRLFGTKPLSEPTVTYCQLDPKEHISWNIIWLSDVFNQENAYENVVCKICGHAVCKKWGHLAPMNAF